MSDFIRRSDGVKRGDIVLIVDSESKRYGQLGLITGTHSLVVGWYTEFIDGGCEPFQELQFKKRGVRK